MSGPTDFDYGDVVRITEGEHKGRAGAIVATNDPDRPRIFTVEFGDGTEGEVPLDLLERFPNG